MPKNLIQSLYKERATDDKNTQTLANVVKNIVNDTLSGDKYLNELLHNDYLEYQQADTVVL